MQQQLFFRLGQSKQTTPRKSTGNLASVACRYKFIKPSALQHRRIQPLINQSSKETAHRIALAQSQTKHFWFWDSTPGESKQSMPRQLASHFHALAAAALPSASWSGPGNHHHHHHHLVLGPEAIAAVSAFLAVCALALALCASHSAAPGRLRRALASVSRRRTGTEPAIIAAVHQHQVQPGCGDGEALPCVWQRGILMGGKCQLPDFSGVINYDPAGNLVAPARPAGRAVPAIGIGW